MTGIGGYGVVTRLRHRGRCYAAPIWRKRKAQRPPLLPRALARLMLTCAKHQRNLHPDA